MISARPEPGVPVPAAVRELARGRAMDAVWSNELGGLTFALGDERFIKWAPHGSGIDLDAEVARLRWAIRYVSVPHVLDQGSDAAGSWFVSSALRGQSAVSERWTREPERAVAAIGRGLRTLHDTLPVDDCPFGWSWQGEPAPGAPPIDRLVVCHGDACSPNTIVADDGSVSGHVDMGALGVGDRWADLAIATWATQWNYGDGYEQLLLDAYGIDLDAERTAYYRALWGEVDPD